MLSRLALCYILLPMFGGAGHSFATPPTPPRSVSSVFYTASGHYADDPGGNGHFSDVAVFTVPDSWSKIPGEIKFKVEVGQDSGNPHGPTWYVDDDLFVGNTHVAHLGDLLATDVEPSSHVGNVYYLNILARSDIPVYVSISSLKITAYKELCACSSCTSGSGMCLNGSVFMQINQKGNGSLLLHIDNPSTNAAQRSLLQASVHDAEVLLDTNGVRQSLGRDCLVDVATVSPYKYFINFFRLSDYGAKDGNGFYTTNSAIPFTKWTVENPSASTNDLSQLTITRAEGGHSVVYNYEWTSGGLILTSGGIQKNTLGATTNGSDIVKSRVVTDSGDVAAAETDTTFRIFPWGLSKTQEVLDPDGAALTTSWSYFATNQTGSGNVSLMVEPFGEWDRYEYNSDGRRTKAISTFLDGATTAAESDSRSTTFAFDTNSFLQTEVDYVQGQEVARRYILSNGGITSNVVCQSAAASISSTSNLVSVAAYYTSGTFVEEPKSILNPDGTMSLYTYSITNSQKTSTVDVGEPNGGKTAIVDGIRTVVITDLSENQISKTVTDIVSGLTLVTETTASTDAHGRPTRINYNDGTFVTNSYGCCGLEFTADRQGIETSYVYDDLKRVISSTRAGVTTLTTYDAADRVTKVVRKGSDNSEIVTQTSAYDLAGRLTSSTDALGHKTTYSEKKDSSGRKVRTTTYPNGTTRVETYYKDGNLKSITGTAAQEVRYEYGADGDGQFTKEIRVGSSGSTSEWTKTYTDVAGRQYKTVFPDGSYTQNFYNNKNQLVKQRDQDGVFTLFAYNGKGEVEYTALDLNQDGAISFTGTDRITRTINEVVTAHGTTVRRTTSMVWTTDGSNDSITNSVVEVSADGLQTWSTSFGLTTHSQTVYDRANQKRTVTVTNPDNSSSISIYVNDLLQSVQQKNSGGTQIAKTDYTYDAHNRQATAVDARTGKTSFAYNQGDQLVSTTAPMGQVTAFQYDKMGRRSQTQLPDGGIVKYEYTPKGELKKTSGARTYASEYSYDPQGRIKTLIAGGAKTTWNYSSDRGFLTSKTYADGQGPSYTYTLGGRLATRVWARGSLTTTYSNNNAGEVVSVNYSDSTPDVSCTFDRRGRMLQATGSTETNSWTYNDAGLVLTESHSGGPLSGLTVTNTYSAVLLRSSVSSVGGVTSFGYDGSSRLSAVTNGNLTVSSSYLANSSLLDTQTFRNSGNTRLTTTRSWDNLNRLSSITSTPSSNSVLSASYTYNSANQRVKNTGADSSYWQYEYDSLGQVISGKKYFANGLAANGEQFGYAFDTIGNRVSTTVNDRSASYTRNKLNQYTQRTVPGAIDALGTADVNANVSVNNQATVRQGEYFYKGLVVTNSSGPAYQSIMASGVKNGATNAVDVVTEVTGSVYVPQTPEAFSHDADGNLTQDGRWQYTWDAENRLIAMEAISSVPSTAKRKLEFVYDYMGRRIQKKVYVWNGSSYDLSTTSKFLYDGWNCLAEINGSGTVLRTYTWGNDLSGSMQGAGGVGGLLSMSNIADSSNHFFAYDGNGNVVALVNAADGKISAEYEYGPFGESIRKTGGVIANANPYRFSTKWMDDESGLLYYGQSQDAAQ